jgi:hypothetical protein
MSSHHKFEAIREYLERSYYLSRLFHAGDCVRYPRLSWVLAFDVKRKGSVKMFNLIDVAETASYVFPSLKRESLIHGNFEGEDKAKVLPVRNQKT